MINDQSQNKLDPLDVQKQYLENKKDIKQSKSNLPFDTNQEIIDLSMKCRGLDEDQKQSNNPKLRNYIRRGNTIIQNQLKDLFLWGRKGFEKFYDINLDWIDSSRKSLYKGKEGSKEHKALRDVVIEPIEKAFRSKMNVQIVKTNKANGEMFQISYSMILKSWIICSKNVSMLCRKLEDIQQQKDGRYTLCIEMAITWFKIVFDLSVEKMHDLKEYLSIRTLLGEQVGHPDHQHIVRQAQVDILFFAVVQNSSNITCLIPEDTYSLIRSFNLKTVAQEDLGTFCKYDSFVQAIVKVYDKVSSAPLHEEEEGSVLQFVQRDPNQQGNYQFNEFVLSLGKLKTFEQRIWRKLREKLATHISQGLDSSQKQQRIQKFLREIHELTEGQELPHEINQYFSVAEQAFECIEIYQTKCEHFKSHYTDQLSQFFYSVHGDQYSCATIQNDEKNSQNNNPLIEISQLIVIIPKFNQESVYKYIHKTIQPIFQANQQINQFINYEGLRNEKVEKLLTFNPSLKLEDAVEEMKIDFPKILNEQFRELVSSINYKFNAIFIENNYSDNDIEITVNILENLKLLKKINIEYIYLE